MVFVNLGMPFGQDRKMFFSLCVVPTADWKFLALAQVRVLSAVPASSAVCDGPAVFSVVLRVALRMALCVSLRVASVGLARGLA